MSTYDSASTLYDATTTTYDGYGTQLAIPYLTVEVAFDDGPYVASPTWTNVSDYVRAASTRRGRTDDLAVFTGTASLTLSNRDRRFDPFYTSGPYYGKLLPRRQIRIRATSGANTYPVFRGYIAGWPVSYTDAGKDSTVTIECFDALSLISTEETPYEWYDYYIRQKNPTNYWKLDDPYGPQIIDEVGNCTATTALIGPTFTYFDTVPSLVPGLRGNAIKPRPQVMSGTSSQPNVATDGTGVLMFWYQRGDLNDSSFSFKVERSGPTIISGEFFKSGANTQLRFQWADGNTGVTMLWTSAATTFNDTEAHHVAVYYSRNTIVVYFDGVAISGTVSFPFGGTSVSGEPFPAQKVEFTSPYLSNNPATLQSIALFAPSSVIPTSDIPILYRLGYGFLNETSSSRVSRIISTTNFPPALVSTPASPAANLANISQENDLASEFALVNNSEGGELYVDKTGVITLTERNSQNTAPRSTTTQAAFKDTGTDLKYGTSLSIQYDADSIKNDFTYAVSDGTISVTADSSIAAYSRNSASIATQLASKTDATTLANLKLSYFDAPVPAVSPLLVSVTRAAADWQDLLDLELLDQITVTRTPSTGNAVEVRMLVNAVQHDITPGDWNMTVTGSARYSNWFTIDTDFIDGDRLIV